MVLIGFVCYILEEFLPDLDGLPLYLLRLASEVNWSIEKECFLNICRETARFYVLHPWKQHSSDIDDISVSNNGINDKNNYILIIIIY